MTCSHLTETAQILLHQVPANTPVYKDDCMYNFDTPVNNDLGLDVCLQCFRAYSRGAIDYTSQHCKYTQHGIFLNIKKHLKPQLQSDGSPEAARPGLAKLEVKDTNEDDIYDTQYKIYCSVDDLTFDLLQVPPVYQELTNSIINTNSSQRNEEIKVWEQEILPCEHSIEIQQVVSNIDLTKCQQCDLQENLWICLHCGALGCGRQQFGSNVAGNSHALSHYEASGHEVAIKLGSLSATDPDNYDAYCYKCNDEVKVPYLVMYLKTLGIDLTSIIKTEKSLIEMNLDQNMNWQFQLDGKNGEKLPPIYGPSYTGLTNLGNSCYLNSVIQALFDLPPYLDYFKHLDFPNYDAVPDPSKDLKSQLIKIYDGLVSGRYSKPNALVSDDYQLGIKPTMFKLLIGEDHEEFKTNKQQDAFEFLLYILDKFDKQLGLELNQSLKFVMTNKVLCSECLRGVSRDELVDNLAVNIDDKVIGIDDGKPIYQEVELLDSFQQYCEDEIIEGYKCDKCHQTTGAIKSSGFKTFPDYLIVNAKRIKLQNWVPIKLDVAVNIPETLDLNKFRTEIDDRYDIETDDGKFVANPQSLASLKEMGFPENRGIKALYNTGNGNVDEAMNWLFAHMDDPSIDDALEVSEDPVVSEDAINNLMQMGFTYQLSKKALLLNNNDTNLAIEWLFNNPNDDGTIVTSQESQPNSELPTTLTNNNSGTYKLRSVICHKGTSPHTGHYVTFIKKNINHAEKWVLFNDEKVVECDSNNLQDIITNGYIYIFENI